MLSIDFLSRNDITTTFPNEESCIKHLEQLRWKEDVISPFDENSKVYFCKTTNTVVETLENILM